MALRLLQRVGVALLLSAVGCGGEEPRPAPIGTAGGGPTTTAVNPPSSGPALGSAAERPAEVGERCPPSRRVEPLRFSIPLAGREHPPSLNRKGDVFGEPVAIGPDVIGFGSFNSGVTAFSLDGAERWHWIPGSAGKGARKVPGGWYFFADGQGRVIAWSHAGDRAVVRDAAGAVRQVALPSGGFGTKPRLVAGSLWLPAAGGTGWTGVIDLATAGFRPLSAEEDRPPVLDPALLPVPHDPNIAFWLTRLDGCPIAELLDPPARDGVRRAWPGEDLSPTLVVRSNVPMPDPFGTPASVAVRVWKLPTER